MLGDTKVLLSDPLRKRNLAKDSNQLFKLGVWSYFLLIIFEGALRKWFLPGLATPLLIIRDPIALWLIVIAWQRGQFSLSVYTIGMILIAVVGTYTAILFGHGSLVVAVYGARIFLLHFPLMFIIKNIFTREDVVKLGKATVCMTIPMAILITIQFYSPQSAWVNRGVGGDMAGAGFDGALGFFRPPGTFSFTNGTHLFFGFASLFIFYFWLSSERVNYLLLILATISLVAAIPFSISRSLLLQIAISFAFAVVSILQKPRHLNRMVLIVLASVAIAAFLSQLPFFQIAVEAFSTRFDNAVESEGGLEGSLGNRWLGGLIRAIAKSLEQPYFGFGLGMGTNAGSVLLAGKGRTFLIAEEEWGRLIGELGPIMGLLAILIRVCLCVELLIAGYKKLIHGDLLPWMLLSFGFLFIPQAQWAQPTALGFSTLIGGLILASLRSN